MTDSTPPSEPLSPPPAEPPPPGAPDPGLPGAAPLPEAGAASGPPVPGRNLQESLLEIALEDLRKRREGLLEEIATLEQRRTRILQEIGSSFPGQSDAIARRLKGFQEYLVGALQDLAAAAEQIELVAQPVLVQPSALDRERLEKVATPEPPAGGGGPFAGDETLIRDQLRSFSGQPDFYADPWKLRRTLEPAGAALLENWFLDQGGRGAQPSSGSRNRNALLTAAAVAILGELYGDRFQTLVLAGQPERLGEWRRGLQDCLGLGREDFGPSSGIVLFERGDALIERADRLEERGELPFIVVDAAERAVEIPILQFPLWLAFAAGSDEFTAEDDLY